MPKQSSKSEQSPNDEIVARLTEIQLPLRLYVQSLLPGDPAGSDVTQQANATIWKKRGDYKPGTNFRAWAFAIARFEVLNYRKKQARESYLIFSEELENTMANELAARGNLDDRRQLALNSCLKKLRPKDRDLLLRRYGSRGTLGEYADEIGRSLGGLKVTLHRLRNALLRCIQQEVSREEGTSPA